ncbi:MAG: SDR family NAD(P)-dependent oxidoreductase [Bacteroidota bacterium]
MEAATEAAEEDALPAGVTEAQLRVAEDVVRAVAAMPAASLAKSRRLRPLRAALTPLVWRALERSGHEASEEAGAKEAARRAQRRKANREKQREKQRLAAAARAEAELCGLRQSRRERLEVVKASNANPEVSALMVPDGYADEASTTTENRWVGAEEDELAVAAAQWTACYSCRRRHSTRHAFYGIAFCEACAALNWGKRSQRAVLSADFTAVVTGGRVKIGHCVALKLLRCGARVVVTTRFPADALARFGAAPDFGAFEARLEICGVDFRDLRAVEAFGDYVDRRFERGLDLLVNNASQTVRRPRGAYEDLLRAEQQTAERLQASSSSGGAVTDWSSRRLGPPPTTNASVVVLDEDRASRSALAAFFPEGCVDASGQPLDARHRNSWTMTLADVPLGEAAECFAINALAPLSLCSRLKPALQRKPRAFVVNVSAMEAKFHRLKTFYHPHTNAAKAALNMLTRTSAADYARDSIFMNSVDTGWVNDEDPILIAEKKAREQGFSPPLDVVDGAARIVDPIFTGIRTGKHMWGAFLKDYAPTDW